MMKLGKPIKYLAVDPKEVVERVKKLLVQNANLKVKKLDELKGNDVLNELNTLHKQGIEFIEPSDLSGAIRGRHNLYTHLELMVKNAQKSVTLVTTSKGILRKVEALKSELERLNKKGVKIRIAAPVNKETLAAIKDVSKIADVKDVGKLDSRFVIVDGKEIMFMVLNDEEVHPTYDVGVWVSTPFFATALDNMFQACWENLSPADKVAIK